jgi:hypothetical protein
MTMAASLLARSTSLVKAGPTPAFVLARVFAADGARVAAYVRFRSSSSRGELSLRGSFGDRAAARLTTPPVAHDQMASLGRLLLRRLGRGRCDPARSLPLLLAQAERHWFDRGLSRVVGLGLGAQGRSDVSIPRGVEEPGRVMSAAALRCETRWRGACCGVSVGRGSEVHGAGMPGRRCSRSWVWRCQHGEGCARG